VQPWFYHGAAGPSTNPDFVLEENNASHRQDIAPASPGRRRAAAAPKDFRTSPITIVVPFAAGGPTDTVARLVAQSMTTYLKQQVIVENAGGAGGTIGANKVAKSKPDGYTLLLHHIGHTTAPSLYRKLPYDTLNDFEPIGLVTDVPMTIISKKDFRRRT
jgi:tripartite-type tricarboxylate transporter receptor subunit TctC